MYRTKLLIRPRPAFWVALLFAVTAITLAAFSGSWLGYRLGYALMLALAASYLLARLSLRGLEVEIDRHTDRVQEGDSIAGELRIRNASAWPKVWLQVDDPADLPGHSSSFVVSLGARRHRTRRLATVCERRGVYSMGPARVRAGDPFGFFEATTLLRRGRAGAGLSAAARTAATSRCPPRTCRAMAASGGERTT